MTKEIKLDDKKVDNLIKVIIDLSSNNIKSKEFSKSQMVRKIKEKIEEEVKCL